MKKKNLFLLLTPFILTPVMSIAANNILSVHILNQQTAPNVEITLEKSKEIIGYSQILKKTIMMVELNLSYLTALRKLL
ncbi:hypothetical protein MASR2M36_37050 [Providencia sp.]